MNNVSSAKANVFMDHFLYFHKLNLLSRSARSRRQ